jgi:hypothetical protein
MIALLVFPASPLFMAPRILPFAFDSLAAAVVPRGLRFVPGGLRFLPGGLRFLPGGLGFLRFVVSTTLMFMVSRTIFGVPRILPFMASRTLFVAPGSLLFIARGILRFVVFVARFVAREALSVLVRGSPATIDSPPVDRAAAVRVWADSLVVRCAGHQPRVV